MVKVCSNPKTDPKKKEFDRKGKKVMMATWSDSDPSEDREENKEVADICLMVRHPFDTIYDESEKARERDRRTKRSRSRCSKWDLNKLLHIRYNFNSTIFPKTILLNSSCMK